MGFKKYGMCLSVRYKKSSSKTNIPHQDTDYKPMNQRFLFLHHLDTISDNIIQIKEFLKFLKL